MTHSDTASIEEFLQRGADIDAYDREGNTALLRAGYTLKPACFLKWVNGNYAKKCCPKFSKKCLTCQTMYLYRYTEGREQEKCWQRQCCRSVAIPAVTHPSINQSRRGSVNILFHGWSLSSNLNSLQCCIWSVFFGLLRLFIALLFTIAGIVQTSKHALCDTYPCFHNEH